jgi:hypothetical protein
VFSEDNIQKEIREKSGGELRMKGSITKSWKWVKSFQKREDFFHKFHILQGQMKMRT